VCRAILRLLAGYSGNTCFARGTAGTATGVTFDLTPTEAQHHLAKRAHEFAEDCIRPVAAEFDKRQEFPWPVLKQAADQGFYSPLFYRDLIGDPTDVRNLRTRATRDGSDWIIDGHKMWIGNSGIANVPVLNAVVDEELGHRGQALFVVPGGTPGLEMVRKLDKLGCRASHTAELKLNSVRVPGENLLGGEEKLQHKLAKAREAIEGGRHSGSATLGTFEQTRPMVAAQGLGIARAALEYMTAYAKRREAFGAPIIDNQGIAFPIADLATQIDAARLLTWRASWMAANGVPFERGEGSMSKLAASEVAVKATERAIQTMGGWGYITDHPVEKWYRDAKLYTIFEGTSEIQRIVISNALGAAEGKPPLHFELEPSGGPLNKMFGRGAEVRSRVAASALAMKDRVPEPVMKLAMKLLRTPR
jgi:acyl-CoA dehydrogenase